MSVTLIHGDNALEIGTVVSTFRERFNPADVITLDGTGTSLAAISTATRTAGLFDPERLVIVHDLHGRLKGKKDAEVEEIRDLLNAVASTTTLLLLSPEMPADHALAFAVREVGGTVRACTIPRRQELPRWIVQYGRDHDMPVEAEAADLLADLIGANPVALATELTKLSTYAGEGQRITVPMVDELVGAVPQESVFALVDAVAAGNRAAAYRLLHTQLASTSSTPIDVALYLIRMIARQLRILLRIRVLEERGRSQSQIVAELKIQRYLADRLFRQARRLSRPRLVAAFEELAALEHKLKSGQIEAAAGLDLLVGALCA